MRVFGWDVLGQVQVGGICVLVGAPHASNWDFPFMLAAVIYLPPKDLLVGTRCTF